MAETDEGWLCSREPVPQGRDFRLTEFADCEDAKVYALGMVKAYKPKEAFLQKSISACIENGARLIAESYDLEFREPSSSRYFLVTIAQEEFAKAFLLLLIVEGIIPFDTDVQRAMRDHACKHLVGMWMDYIIMHWEELEDLKKAIALDASLGDRLPNDVGSAVEILRYEKMGRWRTGYASDPPYDPAVIAIAEGKKDKRKQDALYVRIGRDGRVGSTPANIDDTETIEEFERAERYQRFLQGLMAGDKKNYRYDKLLHALRLIFSPPVGDELHVNQQTEI